MTGFARVSRTRDGLTAAWEVKSVNGKGLDVRLRLPTGLDRLEAPLRQAFSRHFSRGNLQAALAWEGAERAAPTPVVNHALLAELAGLARRLAEQYGAAPASADGLLRLPGVLEMPAAAETDERRAHADALAADALEAALAELASVRHAEGAALAALLLQHLDAVEAIVARVEADSSREPAAIRMRLATQLRLLYDVPGLDETRLAAEAALLATRADVREELDRLRAHCQAARALLAQGGPVGRRLDFLSQEFNREANTLCSKSIAGAVTAAGLELKAVVDQFREQVQNLE